MKVDARILEVALTVIACIFVGNALADNFLGASSFVPADYYSVGTVLGAIWLLFLIFEPKRLS